MTREEIIKRNELRIYLTLEEIAEEFNIDKETLNIAKANFIKAYRNSEAKFAEYCSRNGIDDVTGCELDKGTEQKF